MTSKNGNLLEDEYLISINTQLQKEPKLIKDKHHVLTFTSTDTIGAANWFKLFQYIKLEINPKGWVGQKIYVTCESETYSKLVLHFLSQVFSTKKFEQAWILEKPLNIDDLKPRHLLEVETALNSYFWLEAFDQNWDTPPF